MLQHLWTSAWRNLKRNIFYTSLCVFGLAIGLGAFAILINYVDFEKGFDRFHQDAAQIYRVESTFANGDVVTDYWATSTFGYAGAMKNEMPEVKDVVRINFYDHERIVRYKENIFREERVVFADSNFFSFFSYALLDGTPTEVLKHPNTMVVSASAAKRYFGGESPIGKMMEIKTLKAKYQCTVTGVFDDFPAQSNLKLDLIMSYMTTQPWERELWYMHQAYTYVKVNSPADARAIEKKFPALAEKYKTEPAMKESVWGVTLVPLTDIHLQAATPYEIETKGSDRTVNFILIIALVILLVAWINYTNIFISKAMERAGEIGVRKMAGARYVDLIKQFLMESLLVNIAAVVLFILAMAIFLPAFKTLYSEDMLQHFWQRPLVWQLVLATFIGGILVTGIVPSLILKGVNTSAILKNKMSFRSGMGNGLRKGLIMFQYFASIVLIVATITIRKQIHFMKTRELGVGVAQTLVFKTPAATEGYDSKMETLVQDIKGLSNTHFVTLSSSVPGKMAGYGLANSRADDPEKKNNIYDMLRVDYDFIDAYNLKVLYGRNFSREHLTDSSSAVLLTESAARMFGFKSSDDAVGKNINLEGHGVRLFNVIGIVKDYHHTSPKEKYRPTVLLIFNPFNWIDNHYVTVKVSNATAALASDIEQKFKSVFPESSFDYFFLDEYFNRQYFEEVKYSSIIMLFTWLALGIVCLGILGLSSFMLLKRTKEIGIRKINGARTAQILQLLNRDFIKLVLIAFVIGTPVAWYAMDLWLQNFAYQTSLDWWIFVLAGVLTLLITVVTVSWQSFRAASQNPVTALRTE